jgi:hypothetical protein
VVPDGDDNDNDPDATFPFYVRHDGFLKATNAEITGKITATSGEIGGITISPSKLSGTGWELTSSGGKIGGWTLGGTSLTNGNPGEDNTICLYTSYPDNDKYWRLLIGSKFKVDKWGNITANGGSIGSWAITQLDGSGFTGLYSNQMSGSSGYQIYLTPKGISHKGYASAGNNANWTSISWGNIIAALASYTDSKLW